MPRETIDGFVVNTLDNLILTTHTSTGQVYVRQESLQNSNFINRAREEPTLPRYHKYPSIVMRYPALDGWGLAKDKKVYLVMICGSVNNAKAYTEVFKHLPDYFPEIVNRVTCWEPDRCRVKTFGDKVFVFSRPRVLINRLRNAGLYIQEEGR